MAGDWIKMSTDLRTHPKVVRIASALKADRLRVVGGLHAVWCLFDAHSEDGSLSGYTLEAVDDLVGWQGFAAAMVAVQWIEEGPDGINLPRFDNHNGQSAKRRAQETERKRLEREAEKAAADAAKSSPPDVRDSSASDADKKRTREEKRREETKEEDPPASRVPRTTRKCPASFVLTPELLAWATEKHPLVDLATETDKLRDHTFKTAISDWDGTWRNWIRRAGQDIAKRPAAATFRERDAEAAAARVAEMTGGILDARKGNKPTTMEIFDATPRLVG